MYVTLHTLLKNIISTAVTSFHMFNIPYNREVFHRFKNNQQQKSNNTNTSFSYNTYKEKYVIYLNFYFTIK